MGGWVRRSVWVWESTSECANVSMCVCVYVCLQVMCLCLWSCVYVTHVPSWHYLVYRFQVKSLIPSHTHINNFESLKVLSSCAGGCKTVTWKTVTSDWCVLKRDRRLSLSLCLSLSLSPSLPPSLSLSRTLSHTHTLSLSLSLSLSIHHVCVCL